MNPHDYDQPWARLTAAARRAPLAGDVSAPYGFATRVAAQAFSAERSLRSLFERFAFRAVAVASLLAVLSVAANYPAITSATPEEQFLPTTEDPVTLLLSPVE
jgi:hypothetical protein